MSVRTWIEQWPVYRQVTGDDPACPRRGQPVPHHGPAATPDRHRRPGGQVDLPVLRGRLRDRRLRQGRQGRADRGRPGTRRSAAAGCARRARPPSSSPPASSGCTRCSTDGRTAPTGRSSTCTPPSRWSPTGSSAPARRPGSGSHDGKRTRRTLGIASLGGAALDNEENYLIKKLWTALGIVQVENQARVCHSSTVAGLGTSFGRGGSTMFMQDLQNSDCIVIQGSNYAEAHPVGFQWVMEAKARGATVIHVDPRFTRTSALADVHVPIRAGTDIAFLGGIINHVLTNELDFREFVLTHTNAATMLARTSATPRTSTASSPASTRRPAVRPDAWGYEGVEEKASAGAARPDAAATAASGTEEGSSGHSRGAARRTARAARRSARASRTATRRCSTRAASTRCSSATTPGTRRRWSSETCGIPPDAVRPGLRRAGRATPDATGRARSRTPWAGPSTPSGRSTSAPPRSCSCCWATSGARAAASRRCAGTPASRAPATSRRSYNLLPGLPADAARRGEPGPRLLRRGARRPRAASGATCALRGQPAQGLLGRRRDRRQRLLLRLPAAADREPRHLRDGQGADRRECARATS